MGKWEMVKLGDVLNKEPKSKIKAGDGLLKGKYKFFTSSKTQTKFINKSNYTEPALIFGTGGNASVHYCDELFATSTDCLVFTSCDNSILLKTIYLYLMGNMFLLENGFKGAGLKHISKDYILNIEIPLPPLEEQKKIASELDKITSLIEKRKEQIEKLDLLVKAKFIEMFGDPIINSKKIETILLGEACNIKSGKTIKSCDIVDTVDNKLYACFGGNGLRGYTSKYTHEGVFPLIGRQGALCGNIQLATGKFYATEHAVVVQSKILLNVYWLFIMLREMNLNRLAGGAAQPGLNVGSLREISIIKPPIDLQNQFADYVQKVEQTKENLEKSLEQLETLYKQRMQYYFE